jgi:hypothetical protein
MQVKQRATARLREGVDYAQWWFLFTNAQCGPLALLLINKMQM